MAVYRRTEIEEIAKKTLKSLGVEALPIDIIEVAKRLGIKIKPFPFTEDISGTLVIENEQATIGYNQFEHRVRIRYTIGHEISHYILHKDTSSVFLDKSFQVQSRGKVHFRSQASKNSEAVLVMEREANALAAALLMPQFLLEKEVKAITFDLGSEEAIKYLARVFDVSSQAMTYRLSNLGYLNEDF